MSNKGAEPSRENALLLQNTSFPYTEAFKTLRTNLQYSSIDSSLKKIIVTSAVPGEGKTTVAINLALTLNQLYHRVIIVDADLRKPMVHRYLQIGNNDHTGLTIALTGQKTLKECVTYVERLGIFALSSGPSVPNPAEVLQSKAMGGLVEELSQNFNYILFDTPPVSIITDAAVLSPLTDGVIFIIRQNYTPTTAALEAVKNLENVKAHMIGCVLNAFDSDQSNHYSSYIYKKYAGYG